MGKKAQQTLRARRGEEKELQDVLREHPEWNDEAKLEAAAMAAINAFMRFKPTPKAKARRTVPCPPRIAEVLEQLSWFPDFDYASQRLPLPDRWFDQIRRVIGDEARKMEKQQMVQHLRRELKLWSTALTELAGLAPPLAPLDIVFTIPAEPRELSSRYKINTDGGRAHFTPHESIAILEDIEIGRIRRCPICERLFWAGRVDKTTCSSECGTVWRQRKFRDPKLKAKYKLNRIQAANLKDTKKKGGKQ